MTPIGPLIVPNSRFKQTKTKGPDAAFFKVNLERRGYFESLVAASNRAAAIAPGTAEWQSMAAQEGGRFRETRPEWLTPAETEARKPFLDEGGDRVALSNLGP